jgi:cytidine deaminase
MKSKNSLFALIPRLKEKMSVYRGSSYRIVAVAFSKKGNMIGISMNGWRELETTRMGTGKHAEASLIKKYGKKVDTIYVMRFGRSADILPVHPCKCCKNMAKKAGVKIVPLHELLNLC